MSALLNDGSLPYGSQVLTINSVAYVAESIKLDDPTKSIDRKGATGDPTGKVLIQDFITGSATLQYALTTTARPANGMVFTADLQRAGSNQNYAITKVSDSFGQEDLHKADIEFYKKIN